MCSEPDCDRNTLARGLCSLHYQRVRPNRPRVYREPRSLQERFWEKVQKSENGCWEWIAGRKAGGYGIFWDGERLRSAHRVSYELAHGSIPMGLEVLHSCDNPPCVNPSHLSVGTKSENMRQSVARKRHRWASLAP